MSGVTIAWDEAVPPITEAAGLGYARIQSDKTSTRMGLDAEHQWPTAGGLAGYHRYGSARPFYGTQSRVSSDGTDARLMLTSDTSQLFAMSSVASFFIGGVAGLSVDSFPGGAAPQKHRWVLSAGTSQTVSGSIQVTYPNSGFSQVPYVLLTAGSESSDVFTNASIVRILGSRTTCFTAGGYVMDVGSGTSFQPGNALFSWQAIGLRAT